MGSPRSSNEAIEFEVTIDGQGGVAYQYDSDDEADIKALLGRMEEPAPLRVVSGEDGAAREIPSLLVDYDETARLLSTTVAALKTRVSRGDHRLHAAMVTNGRQVRFSRAKLAEKFTPRRGR
jgi:hypothetical protein